MEAVKPAEVSILALYNPSLGQSDETLHDQILFYYTSDTRSEGKPTSADTAQDSEKAEKNERLRQIGLAQGLVEFGKAFSGKQPVDTVDTEKTRVLLLEIESGWWILAVSLPIRSSPWFASAVFFTCLIGPDQTIALTCIPRNASASKSPLSPKQDHEDTSPAVGYSAREVCPPTLLREHLKRAHAIFLLHHGASLADLHARLPRPRLCSVLGRFWGAFARRWEVLLRGCPAADVFGGIKLGVGGELGVGVGEEEWGSGERAVLEDFVARTEGLVDLVVSRFGDGPADETEPWLGARHCVGPDDGVVFAGLGDLSRDSAWALTSWMEEIFLHGAAAYGVQDNPHSERKRRARHTRRKRPPRPRGQSDAKKADAPSNDNASSPQGLPELPSGIPPPIVRAASRSLEVAESRAEQTLRAAGSLPDGGPQTDNLMKYMTFGLYNPGRSVPNPTKNDGTKAPVNKETGELGAGKTDGKDISSKAPLTNIEDEPSPDVRSGCFLIGLQGNLEDERGSDDASTDDQIGEAQQGPESRRLNRRTLLRTLYVRRQGHRPEAAEDNETDLHSPAAVEERDDHLQVVIYARQPFMFTFLFELQTASLAYPTFYRALHHQLGPLQRPLLRSTSRATALARLHASVSPRTVVPAPAVAAPSPIYDLVFDPAARTVHSTLPAIPEPPAAAAPSAAAPAAGAGPAVPWARLDALHVHAQIVATVAATRPEAGAGPADLERAAKTARGWWVVWVRLPPAAGARARGDGRCREAVLVRRASERGVADGAGAGAAGGKRRVGSLMGIMGMGSAGNGAEDAAAKESGGVGRLVEGIGVDARPYVEGLLRLHR